VFLKRGILLLLGLLLLASSITAAVAQEVAPNFTLTDIDGVNFSLSTNRGKVVILDFFAIQCADCITEIQTLGVLHQEFGDNVTIVSISITPTVDTVEKLQEFRTANNITWTVARDTEGVADNYSIQVAPTLVIIDPEGYIKYNHVGLTDQSVLQQEISGIVPEFGAWIPVFFVFLMLTAIIVIRRLRLIPRGTCIGAE
jgi:peroxiredoxin